jgi:hypothetical protein
MLGIMPEIRIAGKGEKEGFDRKIYYNGLVRKQRLTFSSHG